MDKKTIKRVIIRFKSRDKEQHIIETIKIILLEHREHDDPDKQKIGRFIKYGNNFSGGNIKSIRHR
jgi:hypothetical protein